MEIVDRLLCIVRLDRNSRYERYFRHLADQAQLTRERLESFTDEFEFKHAVIEYVDCTIRSVYDRQDSAIVHMSPGIRAVYYAWHVQAQVDNGGVHQYFFNKGVEHAFEAIEGYKLLGATKHAAFMAHAIDLYRAEESHQREFCGGNVLTMIEDYSESRKRSQLPSLDEQFPNSDEDVFGLALLYMKTHIDEFITTDR